MTLPLMLLLPLAAETAAVHASIERQFIYLGSTRTTSVEIWAAAEKTYEKRGDGVRIEDRGRGSTWRINVKAREWSEERTRPERNKAAVDIHTLGFEYTPRFAWTLKEAAETRTVAARKCSLTVATGVADYGEVELRLWFCPAGNSPGEARLGELVAATSGPVYEDIARFLKELVARRSGQVLLAMEDRTDPPIAPAMVRRTEVLTLENAPPPEGIFQVPKDFRKVEGR